MTATGVLCEYKHMGRQVSLPYNGPLENDSFEQVEFYFKWLRDLLKPGGLASYSYRIAHTRWHISSGGMAYQGVFPEAADARRFFARYSMPKVFMAVNKDLLEAMQKEVNPDGRPPHGLETVTEKNGLVNNRFYKYAQLDGTSPNGTRVHTWWPGHVYFDYRKFLADNKNWTMDCSVKREAQLDRERNKRKRKGRQGSF